MKTPAWIWQFPQDYPPAGSSVIHQGRNIPVIGPDDGEAPICDAYVKTHDGLWWMGDLYDHPLAPSSGNLQKLREIYFTQGIEFTPWCVPKGLWPVEEAALANRVLEVANRLILDIEPYAWFWTGPWANLHVYMKHIRDAHPNAWIGLSFDPRYGQYDKYADIHFDEWLPYVDALLPQDYWETFGVAPSWQIDRTTARIAGLGKEIIHAIPGHAPTGEFGRAVEAILDHGNRFSIWRRGTYDILNADYVARIQEGEEEGPCADLEEEVDKLQGLLQQSENESGKRLRVIRDREALLRAAAGSLRTTANTLEKGSGPYEP